MAENDGRGPVDQLTLRELAVQEDYEVETPDGWTLVVTRYRSRPQLWGQPLAGVPMLLVHGFSQNRATWTSGEFARDLAYFGADIHILELRGHGKSSRSLQFRKHNREGKRLPKDISWKWDADSYFLQDVPAAIEAVKRRTGRDKLVYIGHSMGGMIGYGIASLRQEDLLGLVTIGSPSDIGQDFLGLQALAWASLALPAIDYALWWVSLYQGLDYRTRRALLAAASRLGPLRRLAERSVALPEKAPKPLRFTVFPVDFMLKTAATLVTNPETALGKLPRYIPLMYNQ
ncbi:MAG: alpha/beta hydrolase, partial [Candidatus Methylomirabilis sp.]|nr:alpha/beta hydrolase [Deltaproteobacteria bacterium]